MARVEREASHALFTALRSGFDANVGNPPWDVMKANSQEFFTDFDPLYRTYDKQAALRKQKELFSTVAGVTDQWDEYNARFKALANWARSAAVPFDLPLARGKEGTGLAAVWTKHRQGRFGFADARHPFRLQGSADLNSYKMFAEVFWSLLRADGRLGVILPTGIYSDFGTKDMREELLFRGRLDFLYAFQNEKRVFAAAHHAFKQVVVLATKGGSTQSFRTRFRMGVGDSPAAHEIPNDLLRNTDATMLFTPDDVRLSSPKTLSLVELKTQRDLDIFRKIYAHAIRVGDSAAGWEITYATEFHMTRDSKLFLPLDNWEATGYKSDVFGRWIGPEGDVALPFYQGSTINQFDFFQKEYLNIQGKIRPGQEIPFESKKFAPHYLIGVPSLIASSKYISSVKIAQRNIANPMNARSLTTCVLRGLACGHSLACMTVDRGNICKTLYCSSMMNSLVLDFVTRSRVVGIHIDWHHLEPLPLPDLRTPSARQKEGFDRTALNCASLTFLHRCFAPEWLRLKHLYPELATKEWKHWWAVTEGDRLRLRVEIDALCADLYGLEPDDFDWIVRDDPTDSKGFYRVDRKLPFRERLTGLAAAAVRALKAGKWSAETAATLSNDKFFEIIGIPEMTAGPDPLIRKREGCHRWKPEEFGKDDPRYGWTWKDCWQDAVALLGSEEAVREYVEGKKKQTPQEQGDEEPGKDGPTDLFGQPLPPKQRRLF